jgi:hypothetical protein
VGPPQVTAPVVRQQATRLIPAVPPAVVEAVTLVNIQTLMWLDTASTLELAPATILGKNVVITIALDHVTWNFGDGSTSSSNSPGKAYDKAGDPCSTVMCPDYFGHVYRQTGSTTITATVSWRVSFRVDGGSATAIPGTVAGPSAQAQITVKQARGVLVPNPQPS